MKPKRKVVWMFSGQGSQYLGMGRELYEHDPVFRESMELCDHVVRPWMDVSLTATLYGSDRNAAFDDTRLTHPAICAVQWAMARTLQTRGHAPDLMLGYSLGEIIAHIVGGALSIEAGLELLHRHATLVESMTPAGGMLAVLADADAVEPEVRDIGDLWIAARNFKNHCVVSGRPEALDRLQRRIEERKTVVQRLPVRRAFHSPLMEAARPEFGRHVEAVSASEPACEIRSARDAGGGGGLKGLWGATREPVNFSRAILDLETTYPDGLTYVDMGPAGTLATFVKYIGVRPESRVLMTVTPWGGARKNLQAYEETLA